MNPDVSTEALLTPAPLRFLTVWFVSVPETEAGLPPCVDECVRLLYILIETPFTHGIFDNKIENNCTKE